jgi:Flp pilus assembly protein TadG
MNNRLHKSEQGQAIVYLVLGIVVFFGFVALAIDGGMALADRRNSQNGADSASLAGGGEAARILEQAGPVCYKNWTCSDAGSAIAHADIAAKNRASQNDFTLDNNLNDHNGVDTSCEDDNGKYIDVTVYISATTPSNFLQILSPDALHNEVEAVTRVHPAQPIGLDDAVIGLNPSACSGQNGVTVGGDAQTIVTGGDIFSNGCIQGDGASGSAVVISGTVEGHYTSPGNIDWTPEPGITDDVVETSDFYIAPPALDAHGNCIGGENVNNLPEDLHPGLWCVKGNLNINKDTNGTDVTIYMLNGNLVYNGNASVNLSAPTNPNASPEIPGVLIYNLSGDSITLNGTSADTFTGLIYAPKSDISLSGNADTIFNGQIIGWNVKITGTNNMGVNYDECSGYIRAPFIELYR